MSAIFGILRFDGGEVSARDLERMSNTLAHRGPDGRKFVVDGAVGLGHCLMRVNQEDLFEAQPLRDRDADLTLVADLRIDNREELAEVFGIGAVELRDMPDSALVLRAYKKWGENCAEHLLGDFAFAIWDGRAKKLVLARDHMGQRAIHYHFHEDIFIFATELKGVLSHPDVPRVLCDAAIVKRITCFYGAPQNGATLYEDILGLVGASVMRVGADGTAQTRRYWEPHADPAHENRDEAYYVEAYRRVLSAAVACRLRRLRNPPALCYGGGFDSTAIAGLAGPVLTAQGRKLIAICSVMPEDYRGPVRHARKWADMCARHMPHVDMRYLCRGDATIFTKIERLFQASDVFEGIYCFMFDAIFAQAAAAGARLIMDGQGGDYTVNPRGTHALFHFVRTGRFARFFKELGPYRKVTGKPLGEIVRGGILPVVLPLWLRRTIASTMARIRRGSAVPFYDGPANPALADALCTAGKLSAEEAMVAPKKNLTPRELSAKVLKVASAIPSPAGGAIAATHRLDLTRPFHDKRVVELGLAIPEELYVRKGRDRYLALQALPDIYPPKFRERDWHSDPVLPDLDGMMDAIGPRLRAETALMARDPNLSRIIDFTYLERGFASLAPGQDWRGAIHRQNLIRSLLGFVIAKKLSWAQARNDTNDAKY